MVNLPSGTNTYLLTRPGCSDRVVIDPGGGAVAELADRAEKPGWSIGYALLTHEHYDHISGLPALMGSFDCQLICSRECSAAITSPTLNFSRYLVQRDVACEPADFVCEDLDWSLDWCGGRFRFIPTPGHSRGSICIAIENLLFTGDCLLPNLKRVTKLPGGNKKAMENSLALLTDTIDPETQVYPGHGKPFVLKDATVHSETTTKRLRVAAV